MFWKRQQRVKLVMLLLTLLCSRTYTRGSRQIISDRTTRNGHSLVGAAHIHNTSRQLNSRRLISRLAPALWFTTFADWTLLTSLHVHGHWWWSSANIYNLTIIVYYTTLPDQKCLFVPSSCRFFVPFLSASVSTLMFSLSRQPLDKCSLCSDHHLH